jgi:hypothetical protein
VLAVAACTVVVNNNGGGGREDEDSDLPSDAGASDAGRKDAAIGRGNGSHARDAGPMSGNDAGPPDAGADEPVSRDAEPADAGPDDGGPTHTCSDGKKNGHETGTDCGGSDCAACEDGNGCVVAEDCTSHYCGTSRLCSVPSCDDKMLNDEESDVDCGRGCPLCAVGRKCNGPEDCTSGSCDDDSKRCVCAPTAVCGANECGTKPDGCGGMLTCPTSCSATESCNRDRVCVCDPNKCPTGACSGVLAMGCCKSDGSCGCSTLVGGSCN